MITLRDIYETFLGHKGRYFMNSNMMNTKRFTPLDMYISNRGHCACPSFYLAEASLSRDVVISTDLVFLSPCSRQASGVEGVRVIYGHSELVSESQTYSCSSEVENYHIFPLLWKERARLVLSEVEGVRRYLSYLLGSEIWQKRNYLS